MKKLFFAGAFMVLSLSLFAQNVNKLVNKYIDIKNALVKSDFKDASEAVDDFSKAIKSESAFAQQNELLSSVDKMAKAVSIEKKRQAFNKVSTIMWQVVKKADKLNQPVYYQYCPMKKAYWISKDKEIENPYYGSSMLTCGKVVETKS